MSDDERVGAGGSPRARTGGRRALGRGLDVLLPAEERAGLREVEVERIDPNPNQPRQHFDRAALDELAASIREHGILQPLVVSAQPDNRYRLVVGERRWQAARLAGVPRVPVIVKDATDRETLELALIENLQRADLNPLEEAAAYQRLSDDFGLTQKDIARQVGKSRAAVANTLRLLALSAPLRQAVVDDRISEGHARALLGLPDSQLQLAALERVLREGLNVRQTEELVRRLLEGQAPRPGAKPADPNVTALEHDLQRALGTRVQLRPSKRGGRMVIEWYSPEEFDQLYARLVRP